MTKQTLRSKYSYLSPTERAELFLSTAVPNRDDALDEALRSKNIFDAYDMSAAERRMIIFGSYWLFKLGLIYGTRVGAIAKGHYLIDPEKNTDNLDDIYEAGAALALVLDEFNTDHGGWLRGVAAILECEEMWDYLLGLGKIFNKIETPKMQKHINKQKERVDSFWNHFENTK